VDFPAPFSPQMAWISPSFPQFKIHILKGHNSGKRFGNRAQGQGYAVHGTF
jgi:hypothetical protein